MKPLLLKHAAGALLSALLMTSCLPNEDPGALQNDSRTFSVEGFDRIAAGNAMDITLIQGPTFSVTAQGDKRNLDDLQLSLNGSSLEIQYNKERNRQYTTYFTITIPTLRGVNFSGAVNGRATSFDDASNKVEIVLTGASIFDLEAKADEISVEASGASKAVIKGSGRNVKGMVSGASYLSALDYAAEEVSIDVSGASRAWINASYKLNGTASGASEVVYRGDPQVTLKTSGASTISRQ